MSWRREIYSDDHHARDAPPFQWSPSNPLIIMEVIEQTLLNHNIPYNVIQVMDIRDVFLKYRILGGLLVLNEPKEAL